MNQKPAYLLADPNRNPRLELMIASVFFFSVASDAPTSPGGLLSVQVPAPTAGRIRSF